VADLEEPTFRGTPDDWWRTATHITEAEAADRQLGGWYISADKRGPNQGKSYRVASPTHSSNETRKAALRRQVAAGNLRESDLSPSVRRLIEARVETPAWLSADLVMANREVDSQERVLWRRISDSGRWQMVFDGRVMVAERTMLQLHPAIAQVTEGSTA
jgi:hypothetical protein